MTDRSDLLTIAGAVLVTLGLAAVYWPLALIVPGAGLAMFGIYWARVNAKPRPRENDNGEV